ncbi:MAG: hypothetical protein COA97_09595 [Flavobacteriales bacterium]|nr:MAG: hypothetical protein COA97_09595 [Flavobacteriales bacterium]
MKKHLTPFSFLFILLIIVSCGNNGSYHEQFTQDKPFVSRISDLNKSIEEIRKIENGKLIKDDINLLKYVYEIGKNDTYIVSYLFDEKGCFEIGIDGYFEMENDANNVVDGIKGEMNKSNYGNSSEGNNLSRWKNSDGTVSIELDYKDTKRGLFIATIFANE